MPRPTLSVNDLAADISKFRTAFKYLTLQYSSVDFYSIISSFLQTLMSARTTMVIVITCARTHLDLSTAHVRRDSNSPMTRKTA